MSTHRLRGLYVITGDGRDTELVTACAQAIAGGTCLIQYRDKGNDTELRRAEARALVALCQSRGVPLIVNDDVELAAEVGAQGVHLGRDDPAVGLARRRLGRGALIGLSCYASMARARAGAAAGVDYVAFGSFYASKTKPGAPRARPALLRVARRELDLPVVAIGGITPENGAALLEAGADLLAVVSGVFGQPDPCTAAARYARLFDPLLLAPDRAYAPGKQ